MLSVTAWRLKVRKWTCIGRAVERHQAALHSAQLCPDEHLEVEAIKGQDATAAGRGQCLLGTNVCLLGSIAHDET